MVGLVLVPQDCTNQERLASIIILTAYFVGTLSALCDGVWDTANNGGDERNKRCISSVLLPQSPDMFGSNM